MKKKSILHNKIGSSSSSKGTEKWNKCWARWKQHLKSFILAHFLLLFKLVIAILLGILVLLLFLGKLKPTDTTEQKVSTGTNLVFLNSPIKEELSNKKTFPALTVEREITVSQFKLQDSRETPISIHIQYPCSITFGLNMEKKEKEWLQFKEDTIILYMPPIEALTPIQKYANDKQKKILIQTGQWSKQELEILRERAACMMERQSISEDSCLQIAEESARKQLLNIVHSYGYKHAIVHFAQNNRKKPITAKYPSNVIPNDYNFYTTATGQKMIFYKNGSILHYSDKIPFERLYNLAEFCATSFPRPVEITLQLEKKGYTLLISNGNADITEEDTKHYIEFVKSTKEIQDDLKKMMRTISRTLFDDEPCNIIETDKNNEIVIDYSKL